MLFERVLFGSLMIGALVGLIILDTWLSSPTVPQATAPVSGAPVGLRTSALPVLLVLTALTVLATYELGGLLTKGGYRPATHWAAFVGAGLVAIPWAVRQQAARADAAWLDLTDVSLSMTAFWLAGGVIGAALAVLARKKTEQAFAHMAATVFMFIYLGLLASFIMRIRCLDPGPAGAILVLYCILVIKVGDIGAYFTGRFLGKHPLAPWLSPKKTVEGFFGAVVAAAAFAAAVMPLWAAKGGTAFGAAPFKMSQAIVFGILMATMGHLGDLTESALKRDIGVKHSGGASASFGGLLDILDSPLFAAPVAWWALTILAEAR